MFGRRNLLKSGELAEATVVFAGQHKKVATNDYRKYDFVVDVRPARDEPFRAELQAVFTVGGLKPGEGDVLRVRFDPKSHDVVFDLDGDPRYDIKALRAANEQRRQALLEQPPDR